MKILMIAPEPVFEPRGTPLSVVGRLKAFSDLGFGVDLLTYCMGEDVDFPGIRIFRIPRIPGIRRVKIGPSFTKIPLDFFLFLKSFRHLLWNKYDLIHTHEEASFWGVPLSRMFHTPHVYDMHSSLPQQLKNFRFSRSKVLHAVFQRLENWVLKNADAIITICPHLREYVARLFPEKKPFLIENVVDYGMIFGEAERSDAILECYRLDGKSVVLYTGTFEPYQGLDLLVQSAKKVISSVGNTVFVLVGGHPEQVERYRNKVASHGLGEHFIFTGQVLPQEVASYIRCADVLVSPRIRGTNTPLKIYAYLRSGVPVVATRLPTHTQVLDDDVAVLTEPTPEGFAEGILAVLKNKTYSVKVGEQAKKLAEERYCYSTYKKNLERVVREAVEAGG
ncbi:MAG: glycosyltransferase family 4 protein [bacterium]